jgi:hypothetical protein
LRGLQFFFIASLTLWLRVSFFSVLCENSAMAGIAIPPAGGLQRQLTGVGDFLGHLGTFGHSLDRF